MQIIRLLLQVAHARRFVFLLLSDAEILSFNLGLALLRGQKNGLKNNETPSTQLRRAGSAKKGTDSGKVGVFKLFVTVTKVNI